MQPSTSQEAYALYKELCEKERTEKEAFIAGRKEAFIRSGYSYLFVYQHKKSIHEFRGGTIHILAISKRYNLKPTSEDESDLSRPFLCPAGTYVFEGGKLTLQYGQVLWAGSAQYGSEEEPSEELKAIEKFLSGFDYYESFQVNWRPEDRG